MRKYYCIYLQYLRSEISINEFCKDKIELSELLDLRFFTYSHAWFTEAKWLRVCNFYIRSQIIIGMKLVIGICILGLIFLSTEEVLQLKIWASSEARVS